MVSSKLFMAAILGASTASAQLFGSTILEILNTTQLSPATKFVQLLTSSPEYQPLLSLLSQPGNYTLFVPSDAVWQEMQQQNSSSSAMPSGQTSTSMTSGSSSPSSSYGGVSGNPTQAASGGGGTGSLARRQVSPTSSSQSLSGASPTTSSQQQQSMQQPPSSSAGSSAAQPTQSSGSNSSMQPNPFTTGPLQNFSVTDVICYHLLNGTYLLSDITNDTTIVPTLLTNQTVDKSGYGLPLIISRNQTSMVGNQTSPSGSASSQPAGTAILGGGATSASSSQPSATAMGGESTTTGNQQSTQQQPTQQPQAISNGQSQGGNAGNGFSWYPQRIRVGLSRDHNRKLLRFFKEAQQQQQQGTMTNYAISNGVSSANVTLYDIVASNGVIHVIDKVLAPPQGPSAVIQNVTEISTLGQFLQQAQSLASAIDSAANITIFAPSNQALQSLQSQSMDQDTLQTLLANHIVQQVVYSTNVSSTSSNGAQQPSQSQQPSVPAATTTTTAAQQIARRQQQPGTGQQPGTAQQPGNGQQSGGGQQPGNGQQSGNGQQGNGIQVPTLSGQTLTLQSINQTNFTVNGAQVLQANILLNNGVLHVIDRVLNGTATNQPSSQGSGQGTTSSQGSGQGTATNQPSSQGSGQTNPSQTSSTATM